MTLPWFLTIGQGLLVLLVAARIRARRATLLEDNVVKTVSSLAALGTSVAVTFVGLLILAGTRPFTFTPWWAGLILIPLGLLFTAIIAANAAEGRSAFDKMAEGGDM
jgi:hypothetical protein